MYLVEGGTVCCCSFQEQHAEAAKSQHTHERARSASIDLVSNDYELAAQSDYILSIVPPRDAMVTAALIANASRNISRTKETPLYYLDLNAISPMSACNIAKVFDVVEESDGVSIRTIDGGIIGGAPKEDPVTHSWSKPSLVVSGPDKLEQAPVDGHRIAQVLNMKHIGSTIGQASGLKMCFASMTKGFTAIAIEAFTTAHELDVLPELQAHLSEYSPKTGELAAKGLVGMPPKAYRWVREMEEIADTMSEKGGFEEDLFRGISDVYRTVADDTALGMEKTGDRQRGTTVEDVAKLMSQGLETKRSPRANKKQRTE